MTAYELANELEDLHEQDKIDGVAHLAMPQAATMLRQQQAEIEALKKKKKDLEWEVNHREVDVDSLRTSLHDAKHQWNKETKKWIPKVEIEKQYLDRIAELEKAKTLTDEEITQVFDECYPNNADGDVVTLVDFARAILRKASEK